MHEQGHWELAPLCEENFPETLENGILTSYFIEHSTKHFTKLIIALGYHEKCTLCTFVMQHVFSATAWSDKSYLGRKSVLCIMINSIICVPQSVMERQVCRWHKLLRKNLQLFFSFLAFFDPGPVISNPNCQQMPFIAQLHTKRSPLVPSGKTFSPNKTKKARTPSYSLPAVYLGRGGFFLHTWQGNIAGGWNIWWVRLTLVHVGRGSGSQKGFVGCLPQIHSCAFWRAVNERSWFVLFVDRCCITTSMTSRIFTGTLHPTLSQENERCNAPFPDGMCKDCVAVIIGANCGLVTPPS